MVLLTGGMCGLLLGNMAEPRWSGLPRWVPRGRLRAEEAHFAYGALAAVLGLLVAGLAMGYLNLVLGLVVWGALVVAASALGAPRDARRNIMLAHAKAIGGVLALFVGAYVFLEYVVFRSLS